MPINYRLTAVKSILQAAVNRLETVGWCKGRTISRDVTKAGHPVIAYCAFGAINSVARSNDYALRAVLTLEQTNRLDSIVSYNDRKSTRKRDVVAKFKKTLKSLST